jgi:molecular chaperone GrpE
MDEQDQEQELPAENPESIEDLPTLEEFASAAMRPKQVMITDEELKKLQHELMDYKDKYLRLLADAENARKRLQKEKQDISRYAIENIVLEMLQPIDNLENALRFAQDMSDEVRNWAVGFQMILAQFKDTLAQNGIIATESLGNTFDPHLHEAIEMVETTAQPPGSIVEECRKGYKMGEKTIRPARVKVAKSPDLSTKQENNEEN